MTTTSASSWRETLASCILIAQRVHGALGCNSVLVLHRSQWRCLASSYNVVLQSLILLLDHACSILGPLEQESMCCKLAGPLHALHQAVQEGEGSMQDFIPRRSSNSNHSWLVNQALKLVMSTDVVDVHLHHLLWISSAVREQILRFACLDAMVSDLSQQTRDLCKIWAHVDAPDDLLAAQNLLNTIKGEEEGESCHLADFILQRLSPAVKLDTHDALPSCLWVDPEDLKRNPEILGLGGYGKVHETVWLGGRFAVKDFFYVEDNVVFGREAAIQARLCHPNVIPLVCCTKSPSLYKCSLVMELMQHDLRVLMMKRMEAGMDPPFPLIVAVDLMLQIARGMEYLHSDSMRIIHRDLKSSNILVSFPSETGCSPYADDVSSHVHLRIADFGMSKAKYASSRYTTRQTGATPWRAPEVFEINPEDEVEGDQNAKYTNKADVYSFGLVCYEILTGKSPYEGTQIRKRVLAGERPQLPSHCPPALSSYIKSCWHVKPTQRPAFTQICRILRYFKVCILLQNHQNQDATQYNWLYHPLSPVTGTRIDEMLQSFVQPLGTILQPQHLIIPLEMYCCRVVLQQGRDEGETSSSQYERSTFTVHFDEISETRTRANTMSVPSLSSAADHQTNSFGHDRSKGKTKGFFTNVFRWLKKQSCMDATRHAKLDESPKSDLRLALGLVGDFSYDELSVATNNFSSIIGSGGSAQVYLGNLVDGRAVAVKVPNSGGHHVNETMLQELRIASQLRHRNIVPLFGWCLHGEDLLLVYEFMPNGDLGKCIFQEHEGTVLDWRRRYTVVCQLASALKYLHEDSGYRQIVHRDVKTSNIMLDSEWNARLGDCGLALLLENDNDSSAPLCGTIGYLAPEYAISGIVSPASDIYSFGVTVLEVACGRRVMERGELGLHFTWVRELYECRRVMEAADMRLGGNFDEVEMKRLLVLGLCCMAVDPLTRPTIEQVLRILSGAAEPLIPAARVGTWRQSSSESMPGSPVGRILSESLSPAAQSSSCGSPVGR